MWPSCPAAWKSFTLYLLLGIVLACHHRRDYLVRSDSIICNPSMVNRHPASPHASLWRSVRFTIALRHPFSGLIDSAGARLADGLQHRRHKMGGHRPAFVNELGCEDQAAAPKASVQAGLRKMLVEEAEWGSRKPGFRGPAHTCQIQTACSRQAGQLGHRMLGQQRGRRLVDEAGVIGSCFSMTSH